MAKAKNREKYTKLVNLQVLYEIKLQLAWCHQSFLPKNGEQDLGNWAPGEMHALEFLDHFILLIYTSATSYNN